jgi:hypothetical protein
MRAQTPVERIQVLEDELEGLGSRLDSRTTRLWCEVEALKIQLKEVREWLMEIKPCRS